MKKIFSILASLCLILGVIFVAVSCGENGTPSSSQQGTENSDAQGNQNNSQDNSNVGNDANNSGNNGSSENNGDSGNNGDGSSTLPGGGENNQTPDEPTTIKYTVKVVDAFGNVPSESVVVSISQNGEVISEMPAIRGTASFQLEKGTYTFAIMPMEGELYYDQNMCYLTAEEPEKTISIYNYADETSKETIYVYDTDGITHIPYDAVQVEEGATYVKIDRPANSYYLFTPTRGGIYKISYEASRSVTLGYYGSPHNVLLICPIEVKDGAFELEVKNEGVNLGNPGGTTQVVIGIRSFTESGCILKIERIGNATVDMPWTDVQANKGATKVDSYVNSEFVDFDVTDASLKVVFNENDGYYHLNTVDGPIIYIRISSAVIAGTTDEGTEYKYLPSFIAMCETGRLGKVFYDNDGNIILKESYNDMFYQYAELCGENGMYPLNAQLAEVVRNIGEHNGWFNLSSELHIFGDDVANIVGENAWLFACAYEIQKATGTQEKPAVVTASADNTQKKAVMVENGVAVVLRTNQKAQITINNAQGIKIVANNGTEYVADSETGVLSAVITAGQNFTMEYVGDSEETVVYFTFVEYFE